MTEELSTSKEANVMVKMFEKALRLETKKEIKQDLSQMRLDEKKLGVMVDKIIEEYLILLQHIWNFHFVFQIFWDETELWITKLQKKS